MVQDADLFGPTAQLAGAGLSNAGRPRLPLRLMVALLYLEHAFNLSDEELCDRWSENIGVYSSGWIGGGWNIGSGWGGGLISGDVSTIRGITYNANGGIAPVGGTLMFGDSGLLGGVIGPAARVGLSGSYAETGAVGLGDLGSALGQWLYDKLNSCPGK